MKLLMLLRWCYYVGAARKRQVEVTEKEEIGALASSSAHCPQPWVLVMGKVGGR